MTLDLNQLAEGQKFMSLGSYAVSDDGKHLAYSTDNTGFRQYTLYVKDLGTGSVLETVSEKVGSVAWAADNRTLFYSVEEESTKRPYRIYRHALGRSAHDLVYEEKDEAFNVGVFKTRSLRYLVLGIGSHTTSEARYLPADQPTAEWKVVAPRIAEQEYDVDHHGDSFYIRVNDKGRTFRLVKAPVASPGRESWQEVVPTRPEVMLEGTDFFKSHYVLFEREAGLPQLRVVDFASGASHRIAFPEPTYSAFPGANAEFDTTTFRYNYQSLVTPSSTFDYDLEKRTSHAPEAGRGAGRLRPRALPVRARLRDREGRGEGPDLARLQEGPGPRRQGPDLPLRLRLLRLRPAHHLLLEPPEPARPRRGHRHRPHPRRRRPGQALARRGADDEEEEHLHRLHRLRGVPARREVRLARTGW